MKRITFHTISRVNILLSFSLRRGPLNFDEGPWISRAMGPNGPQQDLTLGQELSVSMYYPCLRPPLKIMLFPVHRPITYKGWVGTFFSYFPIFFFFCPAFFSTISIQRREKKKKKEDFAASRLAKIMATRRTGNKLFFKGGLM